jgi:hypothetical protein
VSSRKQKTRLGICRGGWLLALLGPVDGSLDYEVNR